jgi:hypothetical protein
MGRGASLLSEASGDYGNEGGTGAVRVTAQLTYR